jgi:hypothetical protein
MKTMTDKIQIEFTPESVHWSKGKDYNLIFLRVQEAYLKNLLQTRGFLFLNEVLTALDQPMIRIGQSIGWVWNNTESQNIVFEIDDSDFDVDHLIRVTLNPVGDILDVLS